MPLKLNSTGGGSVTMDAPVTANNYTLTAPASSGTIATTDGGNTTFTSITDSGNLTFTGTGNRITGDFSNTTLTNRVMFQTSTAASNTRVGMLPNNPTGTSGPILYSTNDPANASIFDIRVTNGTYAALISDKTGTGSYLPITLETGGSERMRIDTSGNVGIGTSSPAAQLHVQNSGGNSESILAQYGSGTRALIGAYANIVAFKAYNGTNDVMAFYTGASERMRIDSSGNLLIGTTNSTLETGTGFKFIYNSGNPYMSLTGTASTGSSNAYHLYSTGAGAYRFYVNYGGQIFATNTSIAGISDISLKENIRDLETGISEVMRLKPRRFDWKNGDGENVAGFIAQELEQVLPELVYEYKYTDAETKKAIKMGDILPTLVKAIQELKAELDELKAKVNA